MDTLFLGTHGHVAALDPATGEERWRVSLPGTGFRIVSLIHEDGRLFAATRGHVFCLDARNGDVLWRNDLSGLGYDSIYMVGDGPPDGGTRFTQVASDDVTHQAQHGAS